MLSDTLEAAAIKKVLAQFGKSEMGLRESAILTLLASMLRVEECCRLNLGDYIYDRYWEGKNHWLLGK